MASGPAAPRSFRSAHVPSRRDTWLAVIGLCAALLVLPFLVWLLVPSGAGVPRRPTVRSTPASSALSPVESLPRPEESETPDPPPVAAPVHTGPAPVPDAPITGVVLDPDGKPVSRAFVECEDREEKDLAGALSGADGRFNLPPVAAGCAAIARHPDFGPSDSIRLAAGRDNAFSLVRLGAIAGDVVDERGLPVPSYTLAIESFIPKGDGDLGRKGALRKIEDPRGEFLIDGLQSGRYVLSASTAGRPPARSEGIDVETGRTTSRVRIVLSRGAVLSGTVSDADTRQPIAGATVRLDAVSSGGVDPIAPATTDENGAFTLDGVPEGPFSVRVDREGYRTKIVPGLTTRGSRTIRTEIALVTKGDGGGETELTGIGAVLVPTPRGVVIASAMDGSPAAVAGLRRGDLIERIDGQSAKDLTLADCIQRLRGPEGSRVTVAVAREGGAGIEVTITRGTIVR